ncbi:MAG: hypothetical protein QOF26_3103, partial [Baekduia sp.]|nr:hypothetical protein [Baekduia sp.]
MRTTTSSVPIVVALLTALAAGCGGGDGNEAADRTNTGRSSACDLDHVAKQIESQKGIAAWEYPGLPFDARKAAGKTIF